MELGGNAPFLVFADADLDAAIEVEVHRGQLVTGLRMRSSGTGTPPAVSSMRSTTTKP